MLDVQSPAKQTRGVLEAREPEGREGAFEHLSVVDASWGQPESPRARERKTQPYAAVSIAKKTEGTANRMYRASVKDGPQKPAVTGHILHIDLTCYG